MLIEGKRLQGISEVIASDQAVIGRALQAYVEQRPGAARAYGIRFESDGNVQTVSVQQAAQRFVLVLITLT